MAKGKKTGGRKKGTPNKNTADIRALAMSKASIAIKTLSDLMVNGESDAVRLNSCKALLDRAVGKPSQDVDMTSKDKPIQGIKEIIIEGVRPDKLSKVE